MTVTRVYKLNYNINNVNTFVGTFAFFQHTKPTQKKTKVPTSKRTKTQTCRET